MIVRPASGMIARLAFAALLATAAAATVANGAGAQTAAPCPAAAYSLYGARHEPAAPQILAALRHEVPRVLIDTKHGWHVWYVYCPYC